MKIQKRLAAMIAKRSPKRVKINPERIEEVKEAITRSDIRGLLKDGAIITVQKKGISRGRAKKQSSQKTRGRRKGQGSRKGKATARLARKDQWMAKIRLQRKFLRDLKEKNKLSHEGYKELYNKAKGGFFRSKRHLKIYITEHKMIQ